MLPPLRSLRPLLIEHLDLENAEYELIGILVRVQPYAASVLDEAIDRTIVVIPAQKRDERFRIGSARNVDDATGQSPEVSEALRGLKHRRRPVLLGQHDGTVTHDFHAQLVQANRGVEDGERRQVLLPGRRRPFPNQSTE